MQLQSSLQSTRLQAGSYLGRRAHVVCRAAHPNTGGRNSGKVPRELKNPPSSSRKSAFSWLTPVTIFVAGCLLTKADPSDYFQELAPLTAVVLSPLVAALLDKVVEEWRPDKRAKDVPDENAHERAFDENYATKIFDIEVRQQDAAGKLHIISTFQSTCGEMVKGARDKRALLKSYLMQCSELLRHHKPDEVEVIAVTPDGRLATFLGTPGSKLRGLLYSVDKFVVRVLRVT